MKNVKSTLQQFPRKHLLLLGMMFLALIVLFLIPAKEVSSTTRHTLELSVLDENNDALVTLEESKAEAALHWREQTVKSGDALSTLFSRANISPNDLYKLLANNEVAKQLKRIYPGQLFRFATDEQDTLVKIEYQISQLESMVFNRDDVHGFIAEHIIAQPDIQLNFKTATIDNSLFLAGQNAGISQSLIMQLADIFSGVIDFVYDPRKGDSFDILYEEKYFNGEKIANGNILAASYHGGSDTYTAYRYEDKNGQAGYYDANGVSMRKAFLRAPVDFTRISSNFNPGRLHPVFKTTRPHRGIDYAAPTGTPIFAAGDGRVTQSGYSQANGNFVVISHGTAYTTKYLHLAKRYVKAGQTVKQRAVIGTVGMTGYATGPHLHYEFIVNGVHRDPRTILNKLPSATPIKKEELAVFHEHISALKMQYTHRQQLVANN